MVQLPLKRSPAAAETADGGVFQAAVIDLGSHAVRLDLFEAGPAGRITLLEHLSVPFDLGREVFRRGSVSPESLGRLVAILRGFRLKIDEYRTTEVRAAATSALREAFNRELVIDRLRSEAGVELEILESSQEIRLLYLACKRRLLRRSSAARPALGVVIGAGSLYLFCCRDGVLCFCEELPLGVDRLAGRPDDPPPRAGIIGQLVAINLPARLRECTGLDHDQPFDLFLIGGTARRIAALLNRPPDDADDLPELPADELAVLLRRLAGTDAAGLAAEAKIHPESAAGVLSGAALVEYITGAFRCEAVFVTGVTTRSAMIDEIVRQRRAPGTRAFQEDFAAICGAIGRKYGFDARHAAEVARISALFLDKLKRDYDFTPRAAILLDAAARLHDIGRFVDVRRHHRHSAYLIANQQLPGVTAAERRIIAAVARYHRREVPDEGDAEYAALPADDKVTVLKLAAILRVADALDFPRSGRAHALRLSRHGQILSLSLPGGDLAAERAGIRNKGGLFTEVFGLELRLYEVNG